SARVLVGPTRASLVSMFTPPPNRAGPRDPGGLEEFMKRSILVAAAVVLAACGDFSTTIRETDLQLRADRTTAPVGGDIEFRYEAQGRQLNRLVIDYGDGS